MAFTVRDQMRRVDFTVWTAHPSLKSDERHHLRPNSLLSFVHRLVAEGIAEKSLIIPSTQETLEALYLHPLRQLVEFDKLQDQTRLQLLVLPMPIRSCP